MFHRKNPTVTSAQYNKNSLGELLEMNTIQEGESPELLFINSG